MIPKTFTLYFRGKVFVIMKFNLFIRNEAWYLKKLMSPAIPGVAQVTR